jgi:hypothetical protein
MTLTLDKLKKYYEYSPDTGVFTSLRTGKPMGGLSGGYIALTVEGQAIQAHRAAFLWMTGKLPEKDVDHINMVRNDNRWINLRECSRSANMLNISKHKDGVLPKNVFFRKDTNKFSVRLTTPEGYKSIGCFDNLELACLVAEEAREKYHGEYARHI